MKKIYIAIFLIILYIPIGLVVLRHFKGISFDVALEGYTDEVVVPSLSMETALDGSFQSNASSYIDVLMPLRGVLTKSYNTLNYELFNYSSHPVGKDDYLFEDFYLTAEYAIGDENDYGLESNRKDMETFVNHMVSIQKKLAEHGKYFYVYIAPSKADVMSDKVPDAYSDMLKDGSQSAADCLRELLDETDIRYYYCSDMADSLEYPAFYETGIHWSRTYEQLVDQKVIADLSDLTGKTYRSSEVLGVTEQEIPFWRDTDLLALMNVFTPWYSFTDKYYEYVVGQTNGDNYEQLRMFMYGDSFALGFLRDILAFAPDEHILYVNYDNYISNSSDYYVVLDHNWDNLDWQYALDSTDVVTIEITEGQIRYYTEGFAEYLDEYLDNYVEGETN